MYTLPAALVRDDYVFLDGYLWQIKDIVEHDDVIEVVAENEFGVEDWRTFDKDIEIKRLRRPEELR